MDIKYTSIALMALTNNAEYVWHGDSLNNIQWITEGIKTPTQKQIDDKIVEIKKAEENAKSSVQAKLEALGLTAEDLRSIL
jgi:uncharacterized protein YeeX (DUF496 family)